MNTIENGHTHEHSATASKSTCDECFHLFHRNILHHQLRDCLLRAALKSVIEPQCDSEILVLTILKEAEYMSACFQLPDINLV